MPNIQSISPWHLQMEMESGSTKDALFLDVRTPDEFAQLRLEGSVNIELANFTGQEPILQKYNKIFVICRAGVRAEKACNLMTHEILGRSYVLEGGLTAWLSLGYGVEIPSQI